MSLNRLFQVSVKRVLHYTFPGLPTVCHLYQLKHVQAGYEKYM